MNEFLSRALFIARKDVQYMLRARETLLWVFVMPIVFFYFIGTVTSGFGPSGHRKERIALAVGEEPGFLADHLALRLEEQDYEIERPEDRPAEGGDAGGDDGEEVRVLPRRLVLPDRFTSGILSGTPTPVRFELESTGPMGNYDRIRVARAIYTVLADLVVTHELEGEVTEEGLASLSSRDRALTLSVRPAGKRKRIPTGFEQTIPGTMVMFTLLVMTTSGAVLLVVERRAGLLRRLASTPIPRGSVVLGKWCGKMILGFVQIAFAMLTGTVLFGMDWGPDLPMVILVMLSYGAMMASLGLLLGCVARTEGQAVGIGVVSSNVLAALGGCWWPIEITPDWMQSLALFIPTGWAMDAMHKLISFGAGAGVAWPHVLGMLLASSVFGWLATRAFRYQ